MDEAAQQDYAYPGPSQGYATPEPRGQVADALSQAEMANASLHEVITELETRLRGVLMQDGEKMAQDNSSPPRQVLVPIADRIMVNADQVAFAASRLNTILGQLEL